MPCDLLPICLGHAREVCKHLPMALKTIPPCRKDPVQSTAKPVSKACARVFTLALLTCSQALWSMQLL